MAGEIAHSDNKNNGLDSLNLDGASAVKQTGNGSIAGNNFSTDFKLPAEDQIRFRGVQQEIPHFGAVPKRTESLYMKPGQNNQQATFQVYRLESPAHPKFSALLFFIPRGLGAGQLSNAEEEVAPRRGVFARGDSEAGERRHDQGGDLSAELRPQGRDQATAGGGREVPGQPCPLYPQSSYSGEQTVTSKVDKVIIYQSLIFLFPLSMCHRKFIFIDPLNSILEKIVLNLICKES